MRRGWNIVLVLGFLAGLAAPTVASVCGWRPWNDIDEKRPLATRPKALPWSRGSWGKLPGLAQEWDKYFADNFGLRKLLIGGHRLLASRVLGTSLSPAVVVGKSDGDRRWLYYHASATGDGVGLESILGQKPYRPEVLAAMAEQLRGTTALVRSRGAKLVIVVAPDKQTIYPEYLPADRQPKPGTLSRLDQFWAMAAKLDAVPLLDLRETLRQAKLDRQLYYPSDTHWNVHGLLLAYQAIARMLAQQDPAWRPLPVEHLALSAGPRRVGDLASLMGLPAIGGDRDWLLVPERLAALAGPKRGKLLLVADSFGQALQMFFELQFEQVSKRYVTRGTRKTVTAPLLDAEKPDVVILESAERYWTMD
jgi:alginate O-acetyltransferase complex protein AlgJ